MAAELGLLSLTQLQKLSQSQQIQHSNKLNPTFISSSSGGNAWMWNPKQSQEEDDSWEVRAFAEDTGNAMGTTWPPRSYTCTFCRREFRSAQALGGHMNVHRRDRARLHHTQPRPPPPPGSLSSSTSSSALIIPAQEFVANGGLCLLYQLPNPNGVLSTSPMAMNACTDAPSTLLSISPYPAPNTMMNISRPLSVDFPVGTPAVDSTHFYPKSEVPSVSDEMGNSTDDDNKTDNYKESAAIEELDLELRLGQGPTPS